MLQALLHTGYRIVRRVFRFELSIVFILDQVDDLVSVNKDDSQNNGDEYRVAALTKAEIIEFSTDPELELLAEMASRLDQGNSCYGVFRKNELVAYGWFAKREIEAEHNFGCDVRTGVGFTFDDDLCFLYKVFTHHDFRGQGLFQRVLKGSANDLMQLNINRIFTTTEWTNRSARRGFEKAGFKSIGFVASYLLFGKQMTHCFQEQFEQHGIKRQ